MTKLPGASYVDERTLVGVAAMNDHARDYQETLRRKRPLADIRRFAALADRGAVVLDAGCGPATDLRLLTDAGVHPIGVDLSMGALTEARLLLPRHGLILAPYQRLPFRENTFGGIWMSNSFTFLPRADWPAAFATMMGLLAKGPVYFSCHRNTSDMQETEDPILGAVPQSGATEEEVAKLFAAHGLTDVTVEVRPDPILERARPLVVALGRRV